MFTKYNKNHVAHTYHLLFNKSKEIFGEKNIDSHLLLCGGSVYIQEKRGCKLVLLEYLQ